MTKIDRKQKEFLKAMKKKFSESTPESKQEVTNAHPTLDPYSNYWKSNRAANDKYR
jgi:hypothetical protein